MNFTESEDGNGNWVLSHESGARLEANFGWAPASEAMELAFRNVESKAKRRPSVPSPVAWLEDLEVPSELRGKGIGSALVRRFEEIAREKGDAGVVLVSASPFGEDPTPFYERLGYTVVGTGAYGDVMHKDLSVRRNSDEDLRRLRRAVESDPKDSVALERYLVALGRAGRLWATVISGFHQKVSVRLHEEGARVRGRKPEILREIRRYEGKGMDIAAMKNRGALRRLLEELRSRYGARSRYLELREAWEKDRPEVFEQGGNAWASQARAEGARGRREGVVGWNPGDDDDDGDEDEEFSPADYMSWTHGDCWILAVALREVTGLPIYGLLGDGQVHHAFVYDKRSDDVIDGHGRRPASKLLSESRREAQSLVELADEKIAELSVGGMNSDAAQADRACPAVVSKGYSDEEWEYALEEAERIAGDMAFNPVRRNSDEELRRLERATITSPDEESVERLASAYTRAGLILNREALKFFIRMSGVVDPSAQVKRAINLARAEAEARRRGWTFRWTEDPNGCGGCDCDNQDCKCSSGAEHDTLDVLVIDENGRVHPGASLSGICSPSRDYGRFVEADLAEDALEATRRMEGS